MPGAVGGNEVAPRLFERVGGFGIALLRMQRARQAGQEQTVLRTRRFERACRARDDVAVQRFGVGEATAFARASRLVQEANCREVVGTLPDLKTKARYRLEGAYAVDWALRAVDVMFGLSGASGLYESGHAARAFRDAHAVKQHFSFNTDIASTTYGRAALGLPGDNLTL